MADKLTVPFRGRGKVNSTQTTLYDGFGNSIPLAMTQTELSIPTGTTIDVEDAGGLKLAGTAVTSTAVELNIMDGVTATAAELNAVDVTAQAETIDSGVAISVLVANTKLDNTTSGAGAITIAVPDASMYGRVKTIEMTVDGGDTTLALTNVQGGTAATTATFADVNDTLVLVGGTSKWHVIGESGVVLS